MKSIRSKEMDLYSHLLGQALYPMPLSSPAFKLSGCPVPDCVRVRGHTCAEAGHQKAAGVLIQIHCFLRLCRLHEFPNLSVPPSPD